MAKALSIIIPCFNCEKTLREAVDSCYSQGFTEDEFEIVMVDDRSTDTTRTLMEQLKSEHTNIRLFFHDQNQGGGGARNTAVEHTTTSVIFCLDSDDILPPLTMHKLYTHLTKNHCDGVGIQTSIKFIGTNVNDISVIHTFTRANERIVLDDLLQRDGLCSLYSTFMFTKDAFTKAGGYPTDHGFDTQGFAWRFLTAKLYAETCPEASYLHRVQFHESYYLREFNDGKVNFNWFAIFTENIHLFSEETRQFILNFNLLDFTKDIYTELCKKSNVFTPHPTFKADTSVQKIAVRPIKRKSVRGIIYRIMARLRTTLRTNDTLKSFIMSFYFTYLDISSRAREKHSVRLLYNYVKLRIKKIFKIGFFPGVEGDLLRIDIVVPTISKDFEMLELYISHLKNNIGHTIGNVYVVAPNSDNRLKEYCENNDLVFIDEQSVLGYGKTATPYLFNGTDRSGWLFQQLLKLSGDMFVTHKKYIIVDSDTILLNKHTFYEQGKDVFFESTEWNSPYFTSFEKLFGYPPPHSLSLTSHMMIFDKDHLAEMKQHIERRHGLPWDKAYTQCCDRSTPSGISDYETYAQWVIKNYPTQVITKPLYNRPYSRKRLHSLGEFLQTFKKRCNSLSFHSHI